MPVVPYTTPTKGSALLPAGVLEWVLNANPLTYTKASNYLALLEGVGLLVSALKDGAFVKPATETEIGDKNDKNYLTAKNFANLIAIKGESNSLNKVPSAALAKRWATAAETNAIATSKTAIDVEAKKVEALEQRVAALEQIKKPFVEGNVFYIPLNNAANESFALQWVQDRPSGNHNWPVRWKLIYAAFATLRKRSSEGGMGFISRYSSVNYSLTSTRGRFIAQNVLGLGQMAKDAPTPPAD